MIPYHSIEKLKEQFQTWSGEEVDVIQPLPVSGSTREYLLLHGVTASALGAYHPNPREYNAFTTFSQLLKKAGLPVPDLYSMDMETHTYLVEYLGAETMLEALINKRAEREFDEEIYQQYTRAIDLMIRMQFEGHKVMDYTHSYPSPEFDRIAIQSDLDYFRYCFVRPSGVVFDERNLLEEFQLITSNAFQAGPRRFMHRDFQARNIVFKGKEPYLLDYQGGMEGPVQYDLASLINQARAGIPNLDKEKLIEYYIGSIPVHLERERFITDYSWISLVRYLQVLGAYGYRGWLERKPHFILSIRPALSALSQLLKADIGKTLPELRTMAERLLENERVRVVDKGIVKKLQVTVNSFSYKNGIPEDYSGHGGGFVFDCRSLANPGRLPAFRMKTGLDREVIKYIEEEGSMKSFIGAVKQLLGSSVEEYLERDFKSLSVSFGCTGGQHRSVYAAEITSEWLRSNYAIEVLLKHRELR